MSTFSAVFGNITPMALKVTLLHTIFMKNLAVRNCSAVEIVKVQEEIFLSTRSFWRGKWFESRNGVLKLVFLAVLLSAFFFEHRLRFYEKSSRAKLFQCYYFEGFRHVLS